MSTYLVTFKDRGNCEIIDKTVDCLHFSSAIGAAINSFTDPEVLEAVMKETDVVLVEKLS